MPSRRCRRASSSRSMPPGCGCFGLADGAALVGQPAMDLFDGAQPGIAQGRAGGLPAGPLERSPDQGRRRCSPMARPPRSNSCWWPANSKANPACSSSCRRTSRDEGQLAAELADAVRRDPTTGLWQRHHLLQLCAQRLAKPPAGGVRCLAVIRPDRFSELAARARRHGHRGIPGAVCRRSCARCSGRTTSPGTSARPASWSCSSAATRATPRPGARASSSAWRSTLFPLGARSVRATCSVGLAGLASAESNLDEAVAMALTAVRSCEERGGNQVHCQRARKPGHARAGLRPDLGQAHQGGAGREPLPPGAAADREPDRQRAEDVRHRRAHARQPGARSAAVRIPAGGRAQ